MICPNCGEAIEHMAEYCKYCGKATNAAARYNYRPSVVPIRKAETRPEVSPERVDTSLRDALDRLTAQVQKLPTQKQMKAAMLRYAVILAAFTLLCTSICSIGIVKNRAEIAKLKQMTSQTEIQDSTADLKGEASTQDTTPKPASAATAVEVEIRFDLNLPKDAGVAKFPPTPDTMKAVLGEKTDLPKLAGTEAFRFIGWNTQQDGKGKPFSTSVTLNSDQSSDITLYAQWEKIEKN